MRSNSSRLRPWHALLLAGLLLSGCLVVDMVRYGLPRLGFGSYGTGDIAPDAMLATTQGEPVQLHDYVGGKPLVLIFGSYT